VIRKSKNYYCSDFPAATAEDLKQGPLKVLALRMPTPEVETMFMASFNTTLDQYRRLLAEVP